MTKSRSNATAPNAKGTLVVGNGTDASTTLAVASTAGYVLTVDSAEATGLKWAVVSSPSYTWTSYTPTFTGLTVGNGTSSFVYAEVGDIVFVVGKFTFGSTSAVTSYVTMTTPSNMNTSYDQAQSLGLASMKDAGTGFYYGEVIYDTTSTIEICALLVNGNYAGYQAFSSTIPFTWANNDVIGVSFSYRKA